MSSWKPGTWKDKDLLGKWFYEEGNEVNYNNFYDSEVVILWNLL